MKLFIVGLAALALAACDPGIVDGGEEDLAQDEDSLDGDREAMTVAECATDNYLPFRGDLHSHTGYSDGADGTTPATAFAFARKQAHFDFLAVTDHGSKLTTTEYDKCKSMASSANTPGDFVAICGCEINAGEGHHFNFLFAPHHFENATSVPGIYAKLKSCDGCVGQMNHPASDRFPWTNFTRDKEADGKLHQIEFNGATFADSLAKYIKALDKGWVVGPSWDSDTHQANWGAGSHRTVLFSKELSRTSLHEALSHHRVCAADDKNAALVLKADSCWMGSKPKGRTSATMHVEATDLNAGDGFTRIHLYGPGGKVRGTIECNGKTVCTGSKKLSVTPPTYVFAVAAQADGDHVITAPVWFR
jgi:hypothetical protein